MIDQNTGYPFSERFMSFLIRLISLVKSISNERLALSIAHCNSFCSRLFIRDCSQFPKSIGLYLYPQLYLQDIQHSWTSLSFTYSLIQSLHLLATFMEFASLAHDQHINQLLSGVFTASSTDHPFLILSVILFRLIFLTGLISASSVDV